MLGRSLINTADTDSFPPTRGETVLFEQARQPPIGEDLAAGLARRAVLERVVIEAHLRPTLLIETGATPVSEDLAMGLARRAVLECAISRILRRAIGR